MSFYSQCLNLNLAHLEGRTVSALSETMKLTMCKPYCIKLIAYSGHLLRKLHLYSLFVAYTFSI